MQFPIRSEMPSDLRRSESRRGTPECVRRGVLGHSARRQKPADAEIVYRGADQAAQDRSGNRYPEDIRPVSQPVVLEPGPTEAVRERRPVSILPARPMNH